MGDQWRQPENHSRREISVLAADEHRKTRIDPKGKIRVIRANPRLKSIS
jgi:hypothetical protein